MLGVGGTPSGAPYRSNLAKMGGRLILGIHGATLAAAGKDTGDEVAMTMEADAEPRRGRATYSVRSMMTWPSWMTRSTRMRTATPLRSGSRSSSSWMVRSMTC